MDSIEARANSEGIFIKENESKEEYIARVKKISIKSNDMYFTSLMQLYGFSPHWVDVVFDDTGIYCWEAGISWVDERTESPLIGIQMRKHFETHERLYGLYTKEEVLCHEFVHAARFLFLDSKYDEHFCYFTSYQNGILPTIRTFIGPLFQSSQEVIIILFCILAVLLMACFDSETWFGAWLGLGIFYAFITLVCFFVTRLLIRWLRFYKCKKNLSVLDNRALHVMVRLTDSELELFSTLSFSEICSWVKMQKGFRWQYLARQYFSMEL